MTRRLIVNGPQPPEGEQWCPVCVADYKGAVLKAHGIVDPASLDTWLEKNLSGTGGPVVLAAPVTNHRDMPALFPVVTTAPVSKLGGAVVGVCWTHADTFAWDSAPPAPPRPPGLIVGMS